MNKQDDKRNVTDEFKGISHEDIVNTLDQRGVQLEIAIENLERDFNMGTIVRSANAFGIRKLHVIGRKQWNKRGAMATDKYLMIEYYPDVDSFVDAVRERHRSVVAVDNVTGATLLGSAELPNNAVLVFGSEGSGISNELLKKSDQIVAIEQFGSTRSINVGVASGIAMYEWLRKHYI